MIVRKRIWYKMMEVAIIDSFASEGMGSFALYHKKGSFTLYHGKISQNTRFIPFEIGVPIR